MWLIYKVFVVLYFTAFMPMPGDAMSPRLMQSRQIWKEARRVSGIDKIRLRRKKLINELLRKAEDESNEISDIPIGITDKEINRIVNETVSPVKSMITDFLLPEEVKEKKLSGTQDNSKKPDNLNSVELPSSASRRSNEQTVKSNTHSIVNPNPLTNFTTSNDSKPKAPVKIDVQFENEPNNKSDLNNMSNKTNITEECATGNCENMKTEASTVSLNSTGKLDLSQLFKKKQVYLITDSADLLQKPSHNNDNDSSDKDEDDDEKNDDEKNDNEDHRKSTKNSGHSKQKNAKKNDKKKLNKYRVWVLNNKDRKSDDLASSENGLGPSTGDKGHWVPGPDDDTDNSESDNESNSYEKEIHHKDHKQPKKLEEPQHSWHPDSQTWPHGSGNQLGGNLSPPWSQPPGSQTWPSGPGQQPGGNPSPTWSQHPSLQTWPSGPGPSQPGGNLSPPWTQHPGSQTWSTGPGQQPGGSPASSWSQPGLQTWPSGPGQQSGINPPSSWSQPPGSQTWPTSPGQQPGGNPSPPWPQAPGTQTWPSAPSQAPGGSPSPPWSQPPGSQTWPSSPGQQPGGSPSPPWTQPPGSQTWPSGPGQQPGGNAPPTWSQHPSLQTWSTGPGQQPGINPPSSWSQPPGSQTWPSSPGQQPGGAPPASWSQPPGTQTWPTGPGQQPGGHPSPSWPQPPGSQTWPTAPGQQPGGNPPASWPQPPGSQSWPPGNAPPQWPPTGIEWDSSPPQWPPNSSPWPPTWPPSPTLLPSVTPTPIWPPAPPSIPSLPIWPPAPPGYMVIPENQTQTSSDKTNDTSVNSTEQLKDNVESEINSIIGKNKNLQINIHIHNNKEDSTSNSTATVKSISPKPQSTSYDSEDHYSDSSRSRVKSKESSRENEDSARDHSTTTVKPLYKIRTPKPQSNSYDNEDEYSHSSEQDSPRRRVNSNERSRDHEDSTTTVKPIYKTRTPKQQANSYDSDDRYSHSSEQRPPRRRVNSNERSREFVKNRNVYRFLKSNIVPNEKRISQLNNPKYLASRSKRLLERNRNKKQIHNQENNYQESQENNSEENDNSEIIGSPEEDDYPEIHDYVENIDEPDDWNNYEAVKEYFFNNSKVNNPRNPNNKNAFTPYSAYSSPPNGTIITMKKKHHKKISASQRFAEKLKHFLKYLTRNRNKLNGTDAEINEKLQKNINELYSILNNIEDKKDSIKENKTQIQDGSNNGQENKSENLVKYLEQLPLIINSSIAILNKLSTRVNEIDVNEKLLKKPKSINDKLKTITVLKNPTTTTPKPNPKNDPPSEAYQNPPPTPLISNFDEYPYTYFYQNSNEIFPLMGAQNFRSNLNPVMFGQNYPMSFRNPRFVSFSNPVQSPSKASYPQYNYKNKLQSFKLFQSLQSPVLSNQGLMHFNPKVNLDYYQHNVLKNSRSPKSSIHQYPLNPLDFYPNKVSRTNPLNMKPGPPYLIYPRNLNQPRHYYNQMMQNRQPFPPMNNYGQPNLNLNQQRNLYPLQNPMMMPPQPQWYPRNYPLNPGLPPNQFPPANYNRPIQLDQPSFPQRQEGPIYHQNENYNQNYPYPENHTQVSNYPQPQAQFYPRERNRNEYKPYKNNYLVPSFPSADVQYFNDYPNIRRHSYRVSRPPDLENPNKYIDSFRGEPKLNGPPDPFNDRFRREESNISEVSAEVVEENLKQIKEYLKLHENQEITPEMLNELNSNPYIEVVPCNKSSAPSQEEDVYSHRESNIEYVTEITVIEHINDEKTENTTERVTQKVYENDVALVFDNTTEIIK